MSLFRRDKPIELRWGTERNQLLDVYEPKTAPRGVVAWIHGGFWQAMYGREGLGEHCKMLASDGFVAGNLAYRRVGEDGGGWPNTGTDVVGGLRALAGKYGPLTAVVGHSAGGHLALWASRELEPRPRVVISVAGVNDLAMADRIGCGRGAVRSLVGPDDDVLAAADPAQRVPLGTRTVMLAPTVDLVVPPSLADSYAEAARAAGDDVVIETVPGDHFTILDVGSEIWAATRNAIEHVA